MPRTHKRKLESRNYRNYNDEKVEQALTAMADGRLSIRGASREFKIPYSTLSNKFYGGHGLKPGEKPVFSAKEEKAFVKGIQKCSDWGFPLGVTKIISEDEMEVQGFRSFVKMNQQKFRPVDNDISVVSKSDLISTLPNPKKEGSIHRPEFIFPNFIRVNEY